MDIQKNQFEEELVRTCARSKRYHTGYALLYFYVDTDGSKNKDVLLTQLAKQIQSDFRASDYFARIDESLFVLVCEGTISEQDGAKCAERLLSALKDFSCYIGVALFPHDTRLPNRLQEYAEIALVKAKKTGPNTYQLFSAITKAK